MTAPTRDELGHWLGHQPRDCGDHRTVGAHRAWCHDCGEWCYPTIPCARCELPRMRTVVEAARSWAAARLFDAHVTGKSVIPSAQVLLDALAELDEISPGGPS